MKGKKNNIINYGFNRETGEWSVSYAADGTKREVTGKYRIPSFEHKDPSGMLLVSFEIILVDLKKKLDEAGFTDKERSEIGSAIREMIAETIKSAVIEAIPVAAKGREGA